MFLDAKRSINALGVAGGSGIPNDCCVRYLVLVVQEAVMTTVEKLHRQPVRLIGRLIRSAAPVAAGAIGVAMFATLFFGEALGERSDAPDAAKYSLKVPGGLAFAEFKGYEDWAVISIDHTADLMKVILGNPVAMDAFRAGIPGNGKPLPRWLEDGKGRVEAEEES
jgi:hypothetical protein